jgi:hypothetical protein
MHRRRMKTLAATLLILAALTVPASADSYANARFGYVLTYPAGAFAPQPEAANGDGRHFKALQGGADLAVWGGYNALEQTPADMAKEAARDCASARPYRLVRPTLVVVSCPTATGVLYHKTYIRADVLTTFEFTYPAAEHARWDKVVGQLTLTPAK